MMDGRVMKTNGNGGKTDVGVWFVTYNTPEMWANNFGSGHSIDYRVLLPDGSYGIPRSDDPQVVDFLLEQLAAAKVDFIVFDLTNGGLTDKIPYGSNHNEWIVDNARFTCERIARFNRTHEWQIRYAVAVGCYAAIRGNKYQDGQLIREGISIGVCTEWQAQAVYEQFVADPVYGGDYYALDGKPLLIIHDWGENVLTVPHGWNAYAGERTYGDRFTVRNGQGGEPGTYGWQTRYGTLVHPEVEVICPGQNTHGGKKANILRDGGRYYRRGWETVLSNPSPRIVMLTSFNDYNEDSALFTADTSGCENDYEEQWRDESGQLAPSLYWDMTIDGIRQLREKNGEVVQ